jgi:hypothetical protein
LETKSKKWPLALTDGVPNAAAVAAAASGGAAAAQAAAAAPQKAVGGGGGGVPKDMTAWYHGPISKADADALLLADGGAAEAGKFLIRQKGTSDNDFIMSVVFKKAGSHHALVRTGEGTEFTVNKGPSGATTLEGVVEFLRTKTKKWPVPLKTGVLGLPMAGAGKVKKYKMIKKVVKRIVKKRVKKPVDPNDPRYKDEPASNLIRSNSGLLGFEDWDGHDEPVKGASTVWNAQPTPGKILNPADAAVHALSPNAIVPQSTRVKKSWITKTWRKKKLDALSSANRPSIFGNFGNLVTKGQAEALIKGRTGGSLHSALKHRPSVESQNLFASHGSTIEQNGLQLNNGFNSRMQATYSDPYGMGALPQDTQFADEGNNDDLLNQECTFLGNCTCPDCRGW